MESPEAVRFVSSANNRGFVFVRHWGKSLMHNKNNNGPKIEPCGTPHLIAFPNDKTHLFGISDFYLRDMNLEKTEPGLLHHFPHFTPKISPLCRMILIYQLTMTNQLLSQK